MAISIFPDWASLPAGAVPFLIFLARIVDVSIGTVRIMVVSRGMRGYASILGFFEVLIWLVAIGQVLQNLHGWVSYVSYAAGFAAGTYVGMTIERRLTYGMSIIRIVVARNDQALIKKLRELGIRVTQIEGSGSQGPVQVLFSIIRRKQLGDVLETVKREAPDAFYSVEDVRMAREFDLKREPWPGPGGLLQPFFFFRKSK